MLKQDGIKVHYINFLWLLQNSQSHFFFFFNLYLPVQPGGHCDIQTNNIWPHFFLSTVPPSNSWVLPSHLPLYFFLYHRNKKKVWWLAIISEHAPTVMGVTHVSGMTSSVYHSIEGNYWEIFYTSGFDQNTCWYIISSHLFKLFVLCLIEDFCIVSSVL